MLRGFPESHPDDEMMIAHNQPDESITKTSTREKVWIEIITQNILPGNSVTITLTDEDDTNSNPIVLSATVDSTGKAHALMELGGKMTKSDIANLKATVTYENSTQEATIIVTPYVVNDAYFATKKEEILYDTKQTTKKHIAESGDYLGKIANTLGVSLAELKVQNNLKSDHVAIGQNFTVTLEEKTEKGKAVTFEQITQASVGDAVYLVVATTALQGTTMNIQVRQGKEKGIGEKDTALTLTQNHTALTELSACVGELADREAYLNKDYLCNLAVAQVTLAPKEEKDLQQWHDDLEQLTNITYKHILLFTSCILLFNCSVIHKTRTHKISIIELKDSIVKPRYTFFNELKVVSNNKIVGNNITHEIQKLSENKHVTSTLPEERLQQKMMLSKVCDTALKISDCRYTPEGYKILSNKKEVLNIKYSYNQYSSYDQYFKYACFNLKTGARITADELFTTPKTVLEKYNKKYIRSFKNYIDTYNPKQADEDDQEAYELYKEHLEQRTPFTHDDLSNIELIYNDLNTVTHIRFHYNGQGGVYRTYFSPSYEEFSIEALKPYLTEKFKQQLVLK